MADPAADRSAGRESGGNASSGFRRRLRVFLSTDAIRALQAGSLAWLVGAAGAVAGALLVATEFSSIAYVTTLTASCQDIADPRVRDNCLTTGHESHHWALALLGLFVLLMAFGAAVGGSRPAALALVVAGAIGLAIALLHDLPKTTKTGEVGVAFAKGEAHKGRGFWFEIAGSALAIGTGGFAAWRLRPSPRRRRELDEEAGAPA